MKEQADRVRRSIQEAQIVRPIPESDELSAGYSGDSAAIRRRQQQKQTVYTHPDEADAPPEDDYGYFGDPTYEHPLAYDDDDPHAPIYYDGYTPDSGDQGALTDEEYMPRRVPDTPGLHRTGYARFGQAQKKPAAHRPDGVAAFARLRRNGHRRRADCASLRPVTGYASTQ